METDFMKTRTKLFAGVLSAALLGSAALPAFAQTRGTMPRANPIGRAGAGMRVPTGNGDMVILHGVIPANTMGLQPGTMTPNRLGVRALFGSAIVTSVQHASIGIRASSGAMANLRLSARAIRIMRLQNGTRLMITQTRPGFLRIQRIDMLGPRCSSNRTFCSPSLPQ
jgi:hypothetical protein